MTPPRKDTGIFLGHRLSPSRPSITSIGWFGDRKIDPAMSIRECIGSHLARRGGPMTTRDRNRSVVIRNRKTITSLICEFAYLPPWGGEINERQCQCREMCVYMCTCVPLTHNQWSFSMTDLWKKHLRNRFFFLFLSLVEASPKDDLTKEAFLPQ